MLTLTGKVFVEKWYWSKRHVRWSFMGFEQVNPSGTGNINDEMFQQYSDHLKEDPDSGYNLILI